ncbi:exodeoxyribonuclease III [Brackiella oedipodis]|uniref:exodeoxyribonuclease III n=1 Tax=Brackiella oedipodis TaxID=124225 RepID=UPI00048AD597|nr:exodeoxyribonuclease III [Brackiella oedipodis]
MKIASWNVNSLKVRLPHVLDWLAQNPVDALCLQELKQDQDMFPEQAFNELNYHAIWNGQKTYNGVAILSKAPATQIQRDNPLLDDPQKRLIACTLPSVAGPVRLICVYCPNGEALESAKYPYKLDWFEKLNHYLQQQLQDYPNLVLTGDFNIAPESRDVYDRYSGEILVSPAERKAFNDLLDLGLHDSFRLFPQADNTYSWWDYRRAAFVRNAGIRIDHILVSDALKQKCTASVVDKTPRALERPSDHAPVVASFEF